MSEHGSANSGNYFNMQQVRLRIAAFLFAATVGQGGTPATAADARTAVQRDVEGYAVASCLAAQNQPYLKDQGDGWASAIIQRGKGSLDAFARVAAAVKKELSKGNMAIIRSESEPTRDKPLPVMYCSEIVDVPSVHAAIAKAATDLAPSYRP
jgi:hypothetical protein